MHPSEDRAFVGVHPGSHRRTGWDGPAGHLVAPGSSGCTGAVRYLRSTADRAPPRPDPGGARGRSIGRHRIRPEGRPRPRTCSAWATSRWPWMAPQRPRSRTRSIAWPAIRTGASAFVTRSRRSARRGRPSRRWSPGPCPRDPSGSTPGRHPVRARSPARSPGPAGQPCAGRCGLSGPRPGLGPERATAGRRRMTPASRSGGCISAAMTAGVPCSCSTSPGPCLPTFR